MICIPIISKTVEEAIIDIKLAEKEADVIELRADYLKNPDVKFLIKSSQKPVIVTNRKKSEGGLYEGEERERVKLLVEAMKSGADYIDIEFSVEDSILEEIKNKKENGCVKKRRSCQTL